MNTLIRTIGILLMLVFTAVPVYADRGHGMGMMSDDSYDYMMMRNRMGMMGPGGGMMGYGMGMMRPGMGMMGYGMGMHAGHEMMAILSLNLDDKQRSKVRQLQRELHKQHRDLMDKMMDDREKLEDLYDADKRDAKAIGKAYEKIFDLQRQMIEQSIETSNKALEVLTDEQRKQVKSMRGVRGMGWGMGYFDD